MAPSLKGKNGGFIVKTQSSSSTNVYYGPPLDGGFSELYLLPWQESVFIPWEDVQDGSEKLLILFTPFDGPDKASVQISIVWNWPYKYEVVAMATYDYEYQLTERSTDQLRIFKLHQIKLIW